MILGPKYKIARRLRAPIFEKTQTQKYALREARKAKTMKLAQKTEYGLAMNEKQKARLTYGLVERQFAKYVEESIAKKGVKSTQALFERLEKRIDNVVYRLGLAVTRRFARQMVSHGHITLNGKRVTIPSIQIKKGDVVGVREGSLKSGLFNTLEERMKTHTAPAWLTFDVTKKSGTVVGEPSLETQKDLLFNLDTVIEFYSR